MPQNVIDVTPADSIQFKNRPSSFEQWTNTYLQSSSLQTKNSHDQDLCMNGNVNDASTPSQKGSIRPDSPRDKAAIQPLHCGGITTTCPVRVARKVSSPSRSLLTQQSSYRTHPPSFPSSATLRRFYVLCQIPSGPGVRTWDMKHITFSWLPMQGTITVFCRSQHAVEAALYLFQVTWMTTLPHGLSRSYRKTAQASSWFTLLFNLLITTTITLLNILS